MAEPVMDVVRDESGVARMAAAVERAGVWLDTDSARRKAAMLRWWQPEGYGFVDLGSCAVRYRAHGAGHRAFVFAADPPIGLEHYDALAGRLAPHGRVIVLEMPGFGFSPAGRGFDFSSASVTRAIIAFLEELQVRAATLCFPCLSGYVGARVAWAQPEMVRALVVAQTPSYEGGLAWARSRDTQGLLTRPLVGQLAMAALKQQRLPQWLDLAVSDRDALARLTPIARDAIRRGARWSLATAFQRFLVAGAAPPPVEQPILAIWGKGDRSHETSSHESSRELGRDVRLLEWDDVGHFPELERTDRFVETLLAADVS